MKWIILPLVLASVCLLGAHAVHEHSDAQKIIASQHRLACMEKTGVSPDEVAEVNKHNFENPSELIKQFAYCYFQKFGIIDANGTLNIDAAVAERPSGSDKAEVAKALESCKNKKGEKVQDVVFEMLKCYHTTVPERQIVF